MSRVTKSVQEAKDQAADYFGFTASTYIQVENGKVFEIPNPGLMDDDQQARWEDLQFLLEQCDREEDYVIEQTVLEDGRVLPEKRIPGEMLVPYRINGELLRPPYNVRLAIALFGEDGYAEYKANGGIANQIALEWAKMNREYQERLQSDTKSDGRDPALESVPTGDRV